MVARSWALLVGTSLLGLAALACNGKLATDDTGSSTASRAAKDDSGQDRTTAPPKDDDRRPSGKPIHPGPPVPSGPPAAACKSVGSSASSSGDGHGVYSCETSDAYDCTSGERTLSCSCSSKDGVWAPGSCDCNGTVFPFDCSAGCAPGAEDYAKCNLPAPPSGSSSSASSSSTSSSG